MFKKNWQNEPKLTEHVCRFIFSFLRFLCLSFFPDIWHRMIFQRMSIGKKLKSPFSRTTLVSYLHITRFWQQWLCESVFWLQSGVAKAATLNKTVAGNHDTQQLFVITLLLSPMCHSRVLKSETFLQNRKKLMLYLSKKEVINRLWQTIDQFPYYLTPLLQTAWLFHKYQLNVFLLIGI